jgi:hypothetical protein
MNKSLDVWWNSFYENQGQQFVIRELSLLMLFKNVLRIAFTLEMYLHYGVFYIWKGVLHSLTRLFVKAPEFESTWLLFLELFQHFYSNGINVCRTEHYTKHQSLCFWVSGELGKLMNLILNLLIPWQMFHWPINKTSGTFSGIRDLDFERFCHKRKLKPDSPWEAR